MSEGGAPPGEAVAAAGGPGSGRRPASCRAEQDLSEEPLRFADAGSAGGLVHYCFCRPPPPRSHGTAAEGSSVYIKRTGYRSFSNSIAQKVLVTAVDYLGGRPFAPGPGAPPPCPHFRHRPGQELRHPDGALCLPSAPASRARRSHSLFLPQRPRGAATGKLGEFHVVAINPGSGWPSGRAWQGHLGEVAASPGRACAQPPQSTRCL